MKHTPQYVHDYYFTNINPETLKKRIKNAQLILKGLKFDAIAFSGMSGALLGPPLALKMGKSLIMVRKPHSGSHSRKRVEGDMAAHTYIIVDDFQDTGKTARYIKESVAEFSSEAKLLGSI
jgi:adenine/guanine phosphoribosyltransferase-like PRPP-binding protein